MSIPLRDYRRILRTHGKEAANRANAAGTTDVVAPSASSRPSRVAGDAVRTREPSAGRASTPVTDLTPVQDRFIRIAAYVQEQLGHPPMKSHLERLCEALHFGTQFFRAMREMEHAGALRREDKGETVHFRIIRSPDPFLDGPDRTIALTILRAQET